MLLVEVLPLFWTTIIFHLLAFPTSFQDLQRFVFFFFFLRSGGVWDDYEKLRDLHVKLKLSAP